MTKYNDYNDNWIVGDTLSTVPLALLLAVGKNQTKYKCYDKLYMRLNLYPPNGCAAMPLRALFVIPVRYWNRAQGSGV